MTKKNKLLLLVLAAILLIAVCLGVASCAGGKTPEQEGPTAPVVGTEKRTYTVLLKTGGGKTLEDVGVYFYTDSTMSELVWFAKTDAAGTVSFTDLESTGYVAVLDKVPDGYKVEPYYPLTGEVTEIILQTDMADGDLANLSYKLGDVMMNFSVTDADGNVWVLSDLLAEKDAVVLNFWYLQCAPCRAEFPYLQEAYEQYSDKIALIAMNPINDDDAAIKAFAQELGLTFPMAHCDPNWEKAMQLTAYPTTVVIDRYGTIALIHKGSIDESKVFADAFEFFTADDYEQTTVEDILGLEIKAEGSDSSNPIEIGGKTSFEVTLAPGQTAYYHIYRVDGMFLSVSSKNISAEYNKTTYPSGKGLGFTVNCPDTYTPAAVSFTNDGEETETFTVRLAAKPGTVDNPHTLKLGDFSVSVEKGNEQGVYHTYTPKEDGILTVQCTGISPKNVGYGITLTTQKGNATVQRSLEEDGDKENGTVTIPVKKGVKVQILVSTLPDDTKSYPAATIKCTLSIGEDTGEDDGIKELIQYAVTVTDQDMLPISGVFMNFTRVETTEETQDTGSTAQKIPQQKTGEAGVASVKLEAAQYDVVLTNKEGYQASVTELRLTPERPYASVMMREVIVERATYTVTVTDPEGKPLEGVTVMLGMSLEPQVTDAQGKATFADVVKSDYTVYVTAPEGYTAVLAGYPFENGSQDMTVVLEKTEDEIPDETVAQKEEYRITVEDYEGNPLSGISVQILSGGVPVTSPLTTDAGGQVTASLEAGDYTVVLALDKTQRYYETDKAVLPEGTTSLTIRVAPTIPGEPEDYWFGPVRYLKVGGNFTTMQANIVNYFAFEPTEAGLYRFSTSDASAILSYQGGSMFFVSDMTSSTDYDPATNSFTRNWKQGNIGGTIMIGVTGAEECIIEVTRIGDPILDETDLVPEVYEAKTPPRKFTISKAQGSKLVYVDLSGKTEDYRIVMGSDGYYHLNSADGPLLYINIGPNAPYHSLYHMAGFGPNGVAGTGIKATIYDEKGSAVKRYDFSACVLSYGENADATYGVYPLNEDLRFIVQTAGEYYGWWDSESGNFWLDGVENLNEELGWMFAVCYVP